GRGGGDRRLHGAAHRQPRVAQDGARARQRADRGHAARMRGDGAGSAGVIRRLATRELGVEGVVRRLDRSPASVDPALHRQVAEILAAVRERGDAALLELTARFDRVSLTADKLRVDATELDAAMRSVDEATVCALEYAAERIARFHEASA